LLGGLAQGCACPDATVVLPIEPYRYDALRTTYGWEALPDYECDSICIPEIPPECTSPTAAGGANAAGAGGLGQGGSVAGGAGTGGGEGGFAAPGGAAGAPASGGSGGSAASGATAPIDCAPYEGFAYVSECKLTTIEWTRPAVVCVGTVRCM
jgi:hypothetical protein